jgi:hypothetical protein
MAEFHHYGVPTQTKQPNEIYIEAAKVYITDATKHPYKVEFLRFEPGSPMPECCKTRCHAAFLVPNLDQALVGRNVLIPPFDATPELRCAFITDGEAVIELMQKR